MKDRFAKVIKDKITPVSALYAVFFILIGFMHIYMLDKIPRGINADEIGSAYDAFCLGKYGVDRWLKSWPVYFINYRDGQNALYTYLLVPFIKLFGLNIYAARSVIIISAFVTAYIGSKIAVKIFNSEYAGVLFAALFAICPAFIMMFRFGLESHMMMPTATIMLYFTCKAATEGKAGHFLALGISSGIVLYSYALSYIAVPLFLFFALIYMIISKNKFISVKNFLRTAIPFILLFIPLIIEQVINKYDLPELKIGIFTFPKLPYYRLSEFRRDHFFQKIWEALHIILLCDDRTFNSTPRYGAFYYVSVPLIIIGFIYSVVVFVRSFKDREKNAVAVYPLLWFFAEIILSGFFLTGYLYCNLTRMNGILISVAIFWLEGIWVIAVFSRKIKKYLYAAVCCALSVTYLFLFVGFSKYYFTEYDKEAYPYYWLFYEEYPKEVYEYLEDENNGLKNAHVYLPFTYMYYLWWINADPIETGLEVSENGSDPTSMGRYSFNDQGHIINGEYLFYNAGFSEPEIELFRKWHFNERAYGNYLLLTDPFGAPDFFNEDYALSDNAKIKLSFLGIQDDNESMILYGWIEVPKGHKYKVTLEKENETIEADVSCDNLEKEGTILFMLDDNYESFYQSDKKIFSLIMVDDDKETVIASTDMVKG